MLNIGLFLIKLVSVLFTPVYYLPAKPISLQLSQRECFYLLVNLHNTLLVSTHMACDEEKKDGRLSFEEIHQYLLQVVYPYEIGQASVTKEGPNFSP